MTTRTETGRGPDADLFPLARPGSRVLLVGAGEYVTGSPLPDVPAVERSMNDLAASLREHVGVPSENLRILLNPSSPLEFGHALAQAAREATDALLVHYVGHGLVGPDNELYLATHATDDLVRGLPYTALAYTALRQEVKKRGIRHTAVVLDCCFSGRGDDPSGPPPNPLLEQTLGGGYLLASTAPEELGLAKPGATHTTFTGALIKLLRDGDPIGPERLTLDDLYHYLDRALASEDAPRPHQRSSNRAGHLVLAGNRAYVPRPSQRAVEGPDERNAESPRKAPCPFRGLKFFRPEDAQYFFGREDIVEKVKGRIVAGDDLLSVVGASGSGKTSLLRAGVVPALEALPERWTVATMTPGDRPVEQLAKRVAALSGHERGVLLVDQFEELFTAGAQEAERERFVLRLAELAAGPLRVVFAVRADFYEACARYSPLAEALESRQILVGPMGRDELKAVIEEPARVAGLRLDEGLTDTLLDEARIRRPGQQSAVLPLLSHALLATWQKCSDNLLTLADYRAAGGIEEAVANTAETVYGTMDSEAERPLLRGLLLRLVRLGEGVEDTRRKLPLADLADPDQRDIAGRILNKLTAERLLTVDENGIEIAHEALLYAWPRLRAWIEEDRTTLLTVQQLTDAARAWEQAGRHDADLYRAKRLETAVEAVQNLTKAARTWNADHDGHDGHVGHDGDDRQETAAQAEQEGAPRAAADALGPTARQFLHKSQQQQDGERRRARRRKRVGQTIGAVVCVLGLIAGLSVVLTVRARDEAASRTAVVRSGNLAADAAALSAADPGLAAQLAVAAYRLAPTQDAVSQLYNTLNTPVDRDLGNTGNPVARVAAQSHGPLAAAIDQKANLRIWNLADPTAPVLDATLHVRTEALAFAPYKDLLAGPCTTARLCLWNLANPRRPTVEAQLPLPTALQKSGSGRISSMAVSPDGTVLAAASERGFTLLWSIAEPAHPRFLADLPNPTREPGDALAAVAFAPRGHVLAETILYGSTRLWDVRRPTAPVLTATIKTGYQAIGFSPTGGLLAAVSNDTMGLWRVGDPARPASIKVDSSVGMSSMRTLAFSPDGSQLHFSGTDSGDSKGQLCALDMSATVGQQSIDNSSVTCTTVGFGTLSMAYTSSGALLTGGLDGRVREWHSPLPKANGVDLPDSLFGSLIDFSSHWSLSPNGQQVAAPIRAADYKDSSSVGIWDLSSPDSTTPVGTLPVRSAQVVAHLNATTLLTVAAGGAVRLWNLHDPRHPTEAASLGTADTRASSSSSIFNVPFRWEVDWDDAGGLVSVLGNDDRLHLWRVTGSGRATHVGSLPASDRTIDTAGVFDDGRTAFFVTSTGRDWWDISNPAHPVHRGTSPFPHKNDGSSIWGAGNLVASTTAAQGLCGCSTLRLSSVKDGRVQSSVTVSKAVGRTLGMSSDGHLLAASGSGFDTVTLWNTADPRHPRNVASVRTVQDLSDIAFDPTGHLMAVWNDTPLQLWDVRDPTAPALQASLGPKDQTWVSSIAFSSTGEKLAIAGSDTDGNISLYDTDPAELADRLCSYTGNSITAAQWKKYAPEIPYQKPCP